LDKNGTLTCRDGEEIPATVAKPPAKIRSWVMKKFLAVALPVGLWMAVVART
jgi:hypothetical protein